MAWARYGCILAMVAAAGSLLFLRAEKESPFSPHEKSHYADPAPLAYAHAAANTDAKFGESCDVCHGTGAEFEATKMHAGR